MIYMFFGLEPRVDPEWWSNSRQFAAIQLSDNTYRHILALNEMKDTEKRKKPYIKKLV